MEILPNPLLIDLFAENPIEDEEFPALRRVDREVRGGGDMSYRALEALGDQFEAGVLGSEGRADSNGCRNVSVSKDLSARQQRVESTYQL